MDAHLVKGGPGDDVSSDPADLFWLHYDVGYAFHTVLSFFFYNYFIHEYISRISD